MNDAFFRKWLEYFEWNAQEPDTLPWSARETLTDAERSLIKKSIATFQLGENSEGYSLQKFSRYYEVKMQYARLSQITGYFIVEEQNHAALLARFMEKHGISTLKKNWTDDIFRIIRKPFGFEISLSVLITAEIIALTYYRALREATSARLLKAICNKILDDEKSHVEYESELLRNAQQSRGQAYRMVWKASQRLLFALTVLVVYREHRAVLVQGGYSLIKFVQACWSDFGRFFPRTFVEVENGLDCINGEAAQRPI